MENITVIETFDEKSPDMTLTTWLPYHTSSIEVQDAAGNITNNQTYFDFSAQKGLLDNYLIIIGIITVIIQLCSVFLNSVTLLMFLRNKVLRSSTNFFVLNLAVSDILMAVLVCSFSAVAAFTGSWPLDHIGCVWYGFGFTFFTATSINSMTAIAMERYVAALLSGCMQLCSVFHVICHAYFSISDKIIFELFFNTVIPGVLLENLGFRRELKKLHNLLRL